MQRLPLPANPAEQVTMQKLLLLENFSVLAMLRI
jgi:hypothetical protein